MGINKAQQAQVNGRVEQAKGTVKEVIGKLVGDNDLEVQGTIQKNVGKVQAGLGDAVQQIVQSLKQP